MLNSYENGGELLDLPGLTLIVWRGEDAQRRPVKPGHWGNPGLHGDGKGIVGRGPASSLGNGGLIPPLGHNWYGQYHSWGALLWGLTSSLLVMLFTI